MAFSSIIMLPLLLLFLAIWAGLIYLLILLIRALRKYLRGGEARREKAETRRTLGEVLKAHRMRCQMTQEFVAEALGVSRQAVSKWETGRGLPSVDLLEPLAEALGLTVSELLSCFSRLLKLPTPRPCTNVRTCCAKLEISSFSLSSAASTYELNTVLT